jgi:hypothetical protein
MADRPVGTQVIVHQKDPFALMDRLDDALILRELQGLESKALVYSIKVDGKETKGLSKVGVDECATAMGRRGEAIREEKIEYQILGEGEDREAVFTVYAARYLISKDGQEVKLDQAIGVKRQPLYREAAVPLTLDSPVPGKKLRGQTFRQALGSSEGKNYLEWMSNNFSDPNIREFARKALDGEDVTVQPGRQLNPHWYEAGAMKAARNARFRLIPLHVRAEIMAQAESGGRVERYTDTDADYHLESGKPPEPAEPAWPKTIDDPWPLGQRAGTPIKQLPYPFLEWATQEGRKFGPRTAELQALARKAMDWVEDGRE